MFKWHFTDPSCCFWKKKVKHTNERVHAWQTQFTSSLNFILIKTLFFNLCSCLESREPTERKYPSSASVRLLFICSKRLSVIILHRVSPEGTLTVGSQVSAVFFFFLNGNYTQCELVDIWPLSAELYYIDKRRHNLWMWPNYPSALQRSQRKHVQIIFNIYPLK